MLTDKSVDTNIAQKYQTGNGLQMFNETALLTWNFVHDVNF